MKKIIIIVILISSSILNNSCSSTSSVANKYLTEKHGAIPPDFNNNTTLLFIKHHKSYNKYLIKNTKRIYKGKYELIEESQLLQDEKYKDIEKYRYIFDYNYQSAGYNTSAQRDYLYNVKKFSVLDRKTNKLYKSKITSSFWGKIQAIYLKKLNIKLGL